MKLSILIVNWNTKDLVLKCLESIFQFPPKADFEVIMVDNASTDGSSEAVEAEFGAKIRLIRSKENLGFAKANNLAYENSRGEYLYLLNPDTRVLAGTFDKLVSYLDQHDEVGIVGSKILNPDKSVQPSVRRFPDLWGSIMVLSGLYRLIRPQMYLMDDFDYSKGSRVEQVMGASLVTRRSIVKEIGLFDDNFWLWYEEVDFCKRVDKLGKEIVYLPEAAIIHYGGHSFGQLNTYDKKKTVAKSMIYYFKKHGRKWQVVVLSILAPVVIAAARIFDFTFHPGKLA